MSLKIHVIYDIFPALSLSFHLSLGNYCLQFIPISQVLIMSGAAVLRFAKLTANGMCPTRGSKQAAGYDLYRYKEYIF